MEILQLKDAEIEQLWANFQREYITENQSDLHAQNMRDSASRTPSQQMEYERTQQLLQQSESVEDYLLNKYSTLVDEDVASYDLVQDYKRLRDPQFTDTKPLTFVLPKNLRQKFQALKRSMPFEERKALLEWFVDSMRSEVLKHFDSSK